MRQIKMSRIKQKRSPHRRSKKTHGGSKKTRGKARSNRRYQRGGMLSCANRCDNLIYAYMHDDPVKTFIDPVQMEEHRHVWGLIRNFIAKVGLQNVRELMCLPDAKERTRLLRTAMQNIRMKHPQTSAFEYMFTKLILRLDNMKSKGSSLKELPIGWVMTADNKYVNMFTNGVTPTPSMPILPAIGEDMWRQSILEQDPAHVDRAAEKALYAGPMKGAVSLLLDDDELASLKLPPSYPKGGKTRGCKRTRKH